MGINFNKIKAVLCDLDGTIFFKGNAIDGAKDTIEYLKEKGIVFRFLTNTDSKSPRAMLKQTNSYGFNLSLDEIHTSVSASVKFMKGKSGKSFYPLVSNNILAEYEGMNVREDKADYVIIGDFRDRVSYDLINKAFRLIWNGAEIIALQKGKYFHRNGTVNLDTGGFVKLFEYTTGKEAMIMGKPHKNFFSTILQELNLKAEEVIIIGDDITTDIVGAHNLGDNSILVRTGKYMDKKCENYEGIEPDMIIDSFADLKKFL